MNLLRSFCTYGPIGKLQAPGTMATLATIPLMLLASKLTVGWYIIAIAVSYTIGYYAVKKVLPLYSETDPSEIVIDEGVGLLVTFLALPLSFDAVLIGVALFRFFDISKIGLDWIESKKTAQAVMLDDLVAGLFANMLLHIFVGFGWL